MDLRLYSKQSVRVKTHHSNLNFVDITSLDNEYALQVSNYSTSMQYIEIRRKNNSVAMFLFRKKSDKKEVDFGWWADAEVIIAINEVEDINK